MISRHYPSSDVLEVGCGLGGLLGALEDNGHQGRLIGFDLPHVTEIATRFWQRGRRDRRIEFVPGDFFSDRFPKADVIVLRHVLHNWPQGEQRSLLDAIVAGQRGTFALVILEAFPTPDDSPVVRLGKPS